MSTKKFKVNVSWCENNFCCVLSDEDINGVVVDTNKTLEGLKKSFVESLRFHIAGCIADGDNLPKYVVEGDYDIDYVLDVQAILRDSERFTTMAAISSISGINQKQLSHYATGEKKPRPDKREKIIKSLHEIGRQALAIN